MCLHALVASDILLAAIWRQVNQLEEAVDIVSQGHRKNIVVKIRLTRNKSASLSKRSGNTAKMGEFV